jgi:hypothetical protein
MKEVFMYRANHRIIPHLFVGRALVLLLLSTVSGAAVAYSQGKAKEQPSLQHLSDEQVVELIASRKTKEAAQATEEVLRRGERMIPLLIKGKGDRRPCFAYNLRVKSGDFQVDPSNNTYVYFDEVHAETIEVASLYLISAIYYGTLEFAYRAELVDLSLPIFERQTGNTPALLARAWISVDKWVVDLQKEGLQSLRNQDRDPLQSSNVNFSR